MDADNQERLLALARGKHAGKVRLFLDYGSSGRREVPDPYYGGANGFEDVLDLIEEAADGLLDELLAQSP
jgi:protein-tyrosine phosphatase